MKPAHTISLLLFLTIGLNAQTAPKFEHFKIDLNAPKINFFDAIEHVEIIRLEETEKSLLSYLASYLKTPAGFSLRDTYKMYFFDEVGNFQQTINKQGDGPEEYSIINSFWIKDEHIELFSGPSRILQHYSLEGDYLKTIPVGYEKDILAGSMIRYEGGYLFQTKSPTRGGDADYELIFTNHDLDILSQELPKNPSFLLSNASKRFQQNDGDLYFKKTLSDSVFVIVDSKPHLRFRFDFGNDWTWNDPESMSSQRRAVGLMLNGDKVYEVLPDIGKEYIILTGIINSKTQVKGYINRQTGNFQHFDLRKHNKEDYKINFIKWQDNRLISSIESYDFEEFLKNLKQDEYSIAGGLKYDDFKYSENPVLLRIKFR
ncbi:MAG: 6-bladed beta-propeller [Cytophagia bacterium]|nr:6-bladed beta-propeller [Cytophagia bacterium]